MDSKVKCDLIVTVANKRIKENRGIASGLEKKVGINHVFNQMVNEQIDGI